MEQNIIISGASGNLGQDVLRKLSENNKLYVTTGSRHPGTFNELPNIDVQAVDLRDKVSSEAFVTDTISKAGTIHAGIFLVGGYAPGEIEDTDDEDIERMIHLNFFTAFHLAKPLISHFKKTCGGQLIFIGAKPAIIARQGAGNFAYALSKSLLFRMAEMINGEYESSGITATMIVPGTIDTPTNRKAMPDSDFNKWVPATDVADTIAFILSETGKKLRQPVIKIYNQS